jgi:hypothetical protein
MHAQEFMDKWGQGGTALALNERAGAQAHFIDLCRVLGVDEPADPEQYCFERGLIKTGSASTRGYADVWKRGHFAWEYKAPGANLDQALKQLMMYALPLHSPPLLIVSDRLRIEVHTHFTGTPSEKHVFLLNEMGRPDVQQGLRSIWTHPDDWRPKRSNREITEAAASTFAATAERLRKAGIPATTVSHFLTQCLFCFFAEDVGLLPERLFERLVGVGIQPGQMGQRLTLLFETMRDGGLFGVDAVPWCNGGLFKTIAVPPLVEADVQALKAASAMDWSAIDPSIFGTLFAWTGPQQAQPARCALHRPGHHPAPGRTGGAAPAAGAVADLQGPHPGAPGPARHPARAGRPDPQHHQAAQGQIRPPAQPGQRGRARGTGQLPGLSGAANCSGASSTATASRPSRCWKRWTTSSAAMRC